MWLSDVIVSESIGLVYKGKGVVGIVVNRHSAICQDVSVKHILSKSSHKCKTLSFNYRDVLCKNNPKASMTLLLDYQGF